MTKNGNYIVTKTETHAGKSPKGQCRTIWRMLVWAFNCGCSLLHNEDHHPPCGSENGGFQDFLPKTDPEQKRRARSTLPVTMIHNSQISLEHNNPWNRCPHSTDKGMESPNRVNVPAINWVKKKLGYDPSLSEFQPENPSPQRSPEAHSRTGTSVKPLWALTRQSFIHRRQKEGEGTFSLYLTRSSLPP